jgi:transcription antitermination factor NusG
MFSLFSGISFALKPAQHLNEQRLYGLKQASERGVRRVAVRSKALGFFDEANTEGLIPARSNLRVGQEVRINGGPFDGLTGIIEEPPNAKGRVRVLLRLLNRPTKAEIPVRLVNSGWVGATA